MVSLDSLWWIFEERKALVLESHLFGGFAIAQSEFVTALTNIRKLGYSFIKVYCIHV